MNECRTCLKSPANKTISHLDKAINKDNKNCVDIMMFCLDITVTPDSKVTTNLCNNCYRKIISFYKFKSLSLKNDAYLKSLCPMVTLVDQETSVYVDENGIKHENSLDPDEFGPCIVEVSRDVHVKEELDVTYEDIDDRLSDKELQSLEEDNKFEEIKDDTIKTDNQQSYHLITPTVPIKRNYTKKKKHTKVAELKQMRHVCEECGKSVLNLKTHLAVHQPKSERQMLQCKACPKLFATFSGRATHYQVKHSGLQIECDVCQKKVAGARSLRAHKLRAHEPAAMRHACVLCGRRYISRSVLALHMASHTKLHAFECDLCHKKFVSKGHITRHIRQVHEKLKPYQCHLCSKRFTGTDRLNEHVLTHSKARPHKCEECGKSFKTKKTLAMHRPLHSGVKPFRCQLCDKSFVKQIYLNAHMISHTKEKKHPCQFCGVRFGRSDHRRRHEYTAHQKHLRVESSQRH